MVNSHATLLAFLFTCALAGFAQSLIAQAPLSFVLYFLFACFFLYELIRDLHYLLTRTDKDHHDKDEQNSE